MSTNPIYLNMNTYLLALQSIKRNLVMNLLYGLSTPSVDHYAHAAGFGGMNSAYICVQYIYQLLVNIDR